MFRLALLLLTLCCGKTVLAEPSSDISTLMNRQISLLDWGLFRLEQSLNETDHDVFVSYGWDENEITIGTISDPHSKIESMEIAKRDCDEIFSDFDAKLLIWDGEDFSFCQICNFFTHNGYTAPGLKEAADSLKQRVFYQAWRGQYSCKRKLYGTVTSVSERE